MSQRHQAVSSRPARPARPGPRQPGPHPSGQPRLPRHRPMRRRPTQHHPARRTFRSLALLLSGVMLGVLLGLLPGAPAQAHGIIIPPPDPPAPPIRPLPPDRPRPGTLSLESLSVEATVRDGVATVRVEQRFVNRGSTNAEGTYLFPLPPGATIDSFQMFIGDEPYGGELLSADEARGIYEGIVARNRDPALLQYVGHGAISAQVFPVPPGEERIIALEYSQVVPGEGRLRELVLPAGGAPQVAVNVALESRSPLTSLYSPTHDVAIHRDGPRRATVSYEGSGRQGPQSLRLYFGGEGGEVNANLLTYALPGEPGYFLLLVSPQAEVPADEVQAKDVLLVLDTSGSMAGQKLIQAKAALTFVLERLGPQDRFGLIAFNSEVRPYHQALQSAGAAPAAVAWVQDLEARGGTNIAGALERAQALAAGSRQAGRPQYILFLTDGLPTLGPRSPEAILAQVREGADENQRLFTFGVGHDVNTVLLDGLARENRGTSTYVQPGENLEETLSHFYQKVAQPVLSDLRLTVSGDVEVEDPYPRPLGDLFAGSQLVVAGRYRGSGLATLTIQGTLNGQPREYRFSGLSFPREATERDFVPRLWAGRKVAYLLQEIRLHGENQEVLDEVVALSQRYGIMTPYTAFLIQEPDFAVTDAAGEAVRRAATSAPDSGAGAVQAAKVMGNLYSADTLQAQQEAQAAALPAPADPAAGSPSGVPGPAPAGGVAVDGFSGGDAANAANGVTVTLVPSLQVSSPVRTAGDKTFILRNGVWTDTAYSPDADTQEIAFGSEAYFELAGRYGRYLSVGLPLVMVLEGQAYRIVESEETAPPDEAGGTAPPTENEAPPTGEAAPPGGGAAPPDSDTVPPQENDESTAGSTVPGAGAAATESNAAVETRRGEEGPWVGAVIPGALALSLAAAGTMGLHRLRWFRGPQGPRGRRRESGPSSGGPTSWM